MPARRRLLPPWAASEAATDETGASPGEALMDNIIKKILQDVHDQRVAAFDALRACASEHDRMAAIGGLHALLALYGIRRPALPESEFITTCPEEKD